MYVGMENDGVGDFANGGVIPVSSELQMLQEDGIEVCHGKWKNGEYFIDDSNKYNISLLYDHGFETYKSKNSYELVLGFVVHYDFGDMLEGYKLKLVDELTLQQSNDLIWDETLNQSSYEVDTIDPYAEGIQLENNLPQFWFRVHLSKLSTTNSFSASRRKLYDPTYNGPGKNTKNAPHVYFVFMMKIKNELDLFYTKSFRVFPYNSLQMLETRFNGKIKTQPSPSINHRQVNPAIDTRAQAHLNFSVNAFFEILQVYGGYNTHILFSMNNYHMVRWLLCNGMQQFYAQSFNKPERNGCLICAPDIDVTVLQYTNTFDICIASPSGENYKTGYTFTYIYYRNPQGKITNAVQDEYGRFYFTNTTIQFNYEHNENSYMMDENYSSLNYTNNRNHLHAVYGEIDKMDTDQLDATDDVFNSTPLHWVSYYGKYQVVKFLLENECDPNACCPNTATPLSLALSQNHKQVCELLIENGADLELAILCLYTIPELYHELKQVYPQNSEQINISEENEQISTPEVEEICSTSTEQTSTPERNVPFEALGSSEDSLKLSDSSDIVKNTIGSPFFRKRPLDVSTVEAPSCRCDDEDDGHFFTFDQFRYMFIKKKAHNFCRDCLDRHLNHEDIKIVHAAKNALLIQDIHEIICHDRDFRGGEYTFGPTFLRHLRKGLDDEPRDLNKILRSRDKRVKREAFNKMGIYHEDIIEYLEKYNRTGYNLKTEELQRNMEVNKIIQLDCITGQQGNYKISTNRLRKAERYFKLTSC
eukprot:TRINITY_DN1442_c0_g1_i1.p1 TRINITY_DN1442_c0_g1~~TRINITY_DN1442_c0_g1_i1.p1  ORF type:complete len:884 (+),score=180.28 TRINITY_DN1442_c0_g1_i1:373-2652(+)